MRKIVNKVVREEKIKSLEKEGLRPLYEIIKVSSDDISRRNDNAQQLKELLKKQLPEVASKYEDLAVEYDNNVKQIEELWESEDVKNLIDNHAKHFTKNYERLSNNPQNSIALKIQLLEIIEDKMEQYLPKVATKFRKLKRANKKHVEQKLELLVDVEELVRIIGRMDNIAWQYIWETGKHLIHECGEKANLKEFVSNYIADSELINLCFVETAVINELIEMNFDQILFMEMCKKKRKKGFREGYYLKSFDIVETKEEVLNK